MITNPHFNFNFITIKLPYYYYHHPVLEYFINHLFNLNFTSFLLKRIGNYH